MLVLNWSTISVIEDILTTNVEDCVFFLGGEGAPCIRKSCSQVIVRPWLQYWSLSSHNYQLVLLAVISRLTV